MPYDRTCTASLLGVIGVLTLSLAACHSDTPAQHPLTVTKASTAAFYPPPLPPQPSYEPPAGRDPVSLHGADGRLAEKVVSALVAQPELRGSDIDVSSVDGTVTLRGNASTRDTRRRATQIALSVQGVKRVENDLFIMAGSERSAGIQTAAR